MQIADDSTRERATASQAPMQASPPSDEHSKATVESCCTTPVFAKRRKPARKTGKQEQALAEVSRMENPGKPTMSWRRRGGTPLSSSRRSRCGSTKRVGRGKQDHLPVPYGLERFRADGLPRGRCFCSLAVGRSWGSHRLSDLPLPRSKGPARGGHRSSN